MDKVWTTILVVAFVFIFRAVVGTVLKRKFGRLAGLSLLANALTSILIAGAVIYFLYVWEAIQTILEFLIAFSAITAVILFAVKDIWLENVLAGLSMIGEKNIKIGTEVEIKGKTGSITEMTLTVTKIKTKDGGTMIVPNRMFRQDAFVIKPTRKTS